MDGRIALAYAKRLYDLAEGPQGPQGEPGSGAVGTVAEAYSTSKTYAVGDYVIHDEEFYRCTTAITTAEAFNSAHWTKLVLTDEVSDLKSEIQEVESHFAIGKNLFDKTNKVSGYLNLDGSISSSSSYYTTDFISVTHGEDITASPKCRKFMAYNADKTRIDTTYLDNGSDSAYTFTPTMDGYVRYTLYANDLDNFQVEYGSSATSYEAYTESIANGIELSGDQKQYISAKITEETTPIEADIEEIKESFSSKKEDVVVNATVISTTENAGYYNENGFYSASDSYFYSDLIPVSEGDKITCMTWNGIPAPIRFVTSYNENQTAIIGKGWSNENASTDAYTVLSGVSYIRASLMKARALEQIVSVRTVDGKTVYYANTKYTNILTDKKWVSCGDSFTQGDFSGLSETEFKYQDGKYVGENKVYPFVIGLRTGAEIVNEAIGGSTMAYVDGTHHEFSMANGRYTQIPSDADYITLYFGINDSHHQVPIGSIDDAVNTTFYGAWNIVMQYLIANHPNAKIGIIISNGCDTIDYPNAEIAIAKKYGVGYLDMNSDYKVPILFRVNGKPDTANSVIQANYEHFRVSSTNGHPNVAMHEYESSIIQHWLESL